MHGIVDIPSSTEQTIKSAWLLPVKELVGRPQRELAVLPYNSGGCKFTVLNGVLHALGASTTSTDKRKHYRLINGQWEELAVLPYAFTSGCAVTVGKEIHILGGASPSFYDGHYVFDGTQWKPSAKLPYAFTNGYAVVLNGEIHILGGGSESQYMRKHYKFNGSTWEFVSEIPYEFVNGAATVLDGEIHILGSSVGGHPTKHYKRVGTTWTPVSTLPFNFVNGEAVTYDGKIHILGGQYSNIKHYEYDGAEWVELADLTKKFRAGTAVIYDSAICVGGSADDATASRTPTLLKSTKYQYTFYLPANTTIYTKLEAGNIIGDVRSVGTNIFQSNSAGIVKLGFPKDSTQNEITICGSGKLYFIEVTEKGGVLSGYFIKGIKINDYVVPKDGHATIAGTMPFDITF